MWNFLRLRPLVSENWVPSLIGHPLLIFAQEIHWKSSSKFHFLISAFSHFGCSHDARLLIKMSSCIAFSHFSSINRIQPTSLLLASLVNSYFYKTDITTYNNTFWRADHTTVKICGIFPEWHSFWSSFVLKINISMGDIPSSCHYLITRVTVWFSWFFKMFFWNENNHLNTYCDVYFSATKNIKPFYPHSRSTLEEI